MGNAAFEPILRCVSRYTATRLVYIYICSFVARFVYVVLLLCLREDEIMGICQHCEQFEAMFSLHMHRLGCWWASNQPSNTTAHFGDWNFLNVRVIYRLICIIFLRLWPFYCRACAEVAEFLTSSRNVILVTSFLTASIWGRSRFIFFATDKLKVRRISYSAVLNFS